MNQYILILLAIIALFGALSAETLAVLGSASDYVVAFGIALLLMPWLEYHFD